MRHNFKLALNLTALVTFLVLGAAPRTIAFDASGGMLSLETGGDDAPRAPLGEADGSVGIDYTPEARCSDNNWSTTTPVACNPQLRFTCNPSGKNLSNCPTRCQQCYDTDLRKLKTSLSPAAITVYQPNYYILHSASNLHLKVVQGLFNDAIQGLAASDTSTSCEFAGAPLAFCGTKYAKALIDGACFDTSPWKVNKFCDKPGAYVEGLKKFLTNGTIIAIQLGNEPLGVTANGQTITAAMVSTAAQNLRTVLDADNFSNIPIVVSLVEGQEQTFCQSGAPPAGVDYIAAHPYCNYVASVPPSWPNDGADCWTQVQTEFTTISQVYCGAANTYIGETGYNTGCPNSPKVPANTVTEEQNFISGLMTTTCAQSSPSGFPTFLFAYTDVCPAGGCAPGCSDAGLPIEGNGYFGIFHTKNYMTKGPLVEKFAPPSLSCSD